jgi:long-subunit acyl-CoA synthetase (AMP-forming)
MLLEHYLNGDDSAIALKHNDKSLTYLALKEAVTHLATWIINNNVSRIAIAFDNSFAWVVADLACQEAQVCCVPIPLFFSETQQRHVIEESQCECLLSSGTLTLFPAAKKETLSDSLNITGYTLTPFATSVNMPKDTNKITFTSGSTGTPKGVCLSSESQWQVAKSIDSAFQQDEVNHLCILPLSTLLENIAGIYAPLLHGGTVQLASASARGFEGSRLVNPQALLKLIDSVQPTSIILVPELLMVLLEACSKGWLPPTSLSFIAVGGAHVSPFLLTEARARGLPVYEGYGLSEAVSVSTLNTPNCNVPGSAGKALGHNTLYIDKGEVVVAGNHFLGYLNQPESFYPPEVRTGDLGVINDGVLTLSGRKKNIMVNSAGRNVSPEWIESLLMGSGLLRQALVFCEARPHCVALIVPLSPQISTDRIRKAVELINQQLPDYAQIENFDVVVPFTPENGLLTQTGKVKRDDVITHYSCTLGALYSPPHIISHTGNSASQKINIGE